MVRRRDEMGKTCLSPTESTQAYKNGVCVNTQQWSYKCQHSYQLIAKYTIIFYIHVFGL